MGTGILLDIVFIVIIAAFAYASARRGFVRTAIELVGWVLMLYLAFTLSGPLSEGIYNTYVYDSLSEKTQSIVEDSIAGSVGETADNIWGSLPSYITSGAELFGVTKEGVNLTVNSSLSDGTAVVTQKVMENIVGPIVISVIKWIIVAVLFSIGMFVVRLVAGWLNRLVSFHLIGGINRGLGAALGILKGGLAVFLICLVLLIIISTKPAGVGFVTQDFLDSSYLYGLFLKINPFFV